jgi:Tfp pilus assembly protein PilF
MKIKLIIIFILTFISCQDNRTSDQIISDIQIQIDNSEFQNALKNINKLISNKIKTSEIYTLKGQCENGLNNKSESLQSFQKAISLDKNYYQAYVARAKVKLELGDFISSIEDCNKAMLIKKDFANIYKTKAIAYELLKDEPNAIIQYKAAIKYGDNSGENNYKLGVLILNKGNTDSGCRYLSIAGEKGYMDAYDLIKINCNKSTNEIIDEELISLTQFKIYHNRYAVSFPKGWKVDEITNSDKSMLTVTASKQGHFMTITEKDPTLTDFNFNYKSIYQYVIKEEILNECKLKYSDFKLLHFEKKRINGNDGYYFIVSFSFFSKNLQKTLSGIQMAYLTLNSKTKKIYTLQGTSEMNELQEYEPIYRKTFESFKLL